MRLTEYIDYLNREDAPAKDEYTHLELRDSNGRIKKEYAKAKSEYKIRTNRNPKTDSEIPKSEIRNPKTDSEWLREKK